MKTMFIIIGIIVVLFISFQIYASVASAKTETQAYKVIEVMNEIEIRYYPSATMAMVTSSAKSFRELGSSGFSKLAGYIFGGNKDQKQIAMTSPVHMDINDTASSMSFVMPSEYNKDNLPVPNNQEVIIKTSPEEYVAAIRFSGFASNDDIKKYTEKLVSALKEHNLTYYGNFRFLGYNAPYEMMNRRNEIIVAVNWDSNKSKH